MTEEFKPSLKPLDESGAPKPSLPVPGFWPRLGAFALDAAILTLIAYVTAKRLYPVLYPQRWTFQAVALLVPWLYFFIGYSSLTKGQTIGKYVLGFRVLSRPNGVYLSFRQLLIRASLSYVCLFAYAFFLHFALWQSFQIQFPENTLAAVSICLALSALACAYGLAASVMTGLHPRKLALHDILAGSAVVRSDEQQSGLVFASTPGQADGARIRSAVYPAVVLAVITIFLFAQLFRQVNIGFQQKQDIVTEVREQLEDIETFTLVTMRGPSRQYHESWLSHQAERREKYDELLREGRLEEAQRYTTLTARGRFTGEQFVFFFDNSQAMTSETLVQHPEYQQLRRELPAVAEDLSEQYFPGEEDQPPAPYYSIQIIMREVLPAFLYTEFMIRHFEEIEVDMPAPETTNTTATLEAE